MGEEKALNVGPSGIEVTYERLGDPATPPVLLIMGGGAQMINWPEGLCAELVDRGLHVIRFDSRDAGRSTHFHDAPPPDLQAAMAGDVSSASYTLSDMAADTVGQPDFSAIGGLGGPPQDRQGYNDWHVRALRVIGSPGFDFEEAAVADRAARNYDRGHDPQGMLRQAIGPSLRRPHRTPTPTPPTHPRHPRHPRRHVRRQRRPRHRRRHPQRQPGDHRRPGPSLPRQLWPVFATHIADLVHHAEATTSTPDQPLT